MKNAIFALGFACFGCVWREPLPPVCGKSEPLNETVQLAIAVFDPPWGGQEASNEAALAGCKMWETVGVSCSLAETVEEADIYVDFYSDWDCREDGFVGALGDYHDRKRGVWINSAYPCLPSDIRPWFTHLVAHEIGHLFGISDVPAFCGNAVMNPAIERHQPFTLLSAISEGDRLAFTERYHTSSLLDSGEAVLDCGDDVAPPPEPAPPDEEPMSCASETGGETIAISVWFEPELLAWSEQVLSGCSWWTPVHASCVRASSREDAEVVVREYKSERCGVAGFTYRDYDGLDGRYAVEFNLDCMPEEPAAAEEWMTAVASHELAHTQGVDHVPFFCGEAVMNPSLK
ncbi:hypothetical protein HYT45_02305 [Candidatus Uhrbacteria bacterium]|nr:hypothetical protein [Candidatus Uhrbacteria bacterium]